MYRELYLITEYCKKQEEKREEARESYKAAVRQILEFMEMILNLFRKSMQMLLCLSTGSEEILSKKISNYGFP